MGYGEIDVESAMEVVEVSGTLQDLIDENRLLLLNVRALKAPGYEKVIAEVGRLLDGVATRLKDAQFVLNPLADKMGVMVEEQMEINEGKV